MCVHVHIHVCNVGLAFGFLWFELPVMIIAIVIYLGGGGQVGGGGHNFHTTRPYCFPQI